jgi:hypothetical protein
MPKSPRSSPNPIRVIDVLTFPAVQLLDVTGPVQVFASANDIVVLTVVFSQRWPPPFRRWIQEIVRSMPIVPVSEEFSGRKNSSSTSKAIRF